MPHFQAAILPPALRQSCLFAQLSRIAEENLARDGEHALVAETFDERRQEIRRHLHIAVQQHDDVVPGGAESGIRAAAKTEIPLERQHLHVRKRPPHELGAAIRRPIVDHDDLVFRIVGQGGDYRREVALEEVAPVPVGDYYGGGTGERGGLGGRRRLSWWSAWRDSARRTPGSGPIGRSTISSGSLWTPAPWR